MLAACRRVSLAQDFAVVPRDAPGEHHEIAHGSQGAIRAGGLGDHLPGLGKVGHKEIRHTAGGGGAAAALSVQYLGVISCLFCFHGSLMIMRNTLQGMGYSLQKALYLRWIYS